MLANIGLGLSLLTFDCTPGEDARLDEIHQFMVDKVVNHIQIKGSNCDPRFYSQIALYHSVLSIHSQYAELTARLEKVLDSIDPTKFAIPVYFQRDLYTVAKRTCESESNQKFVYSLETVQSHLKYGAQPVQMSIYRRKTEEEESKKVLIAMFLTNGAFEGHDQKPRRAFLMMKTVYGYHHPNVPVENTAVRDQPEFLAKFKAIIAKLSQE